MTGLLTALGSIALLLLLVGLVKPRWVLPPRWKPNRLKAAGVYLVALVAFASMADWSLSPEERAAQEAASAAREATLAAQQKARQEEQAQRDTEQRRKTEELLETVKRETEAKRIAAEKAKAERRDAEAKAAEEERKNAEANAPKTDFGMTIEDAAKKLKPWGLTFRNIGGESWMASNETDLMLMTLTGYKDRLIKVEYSGGFVKGESKNALHLVRTATLFELFTKGVKEKDRDAFLQKSVAAFNSEETIEKRFSPALEARSKYIAGMGMWVVVLEAK